MILILQSVLAAEPSTYALAAPVVLPATGPVQVVLGPDLVGADPAALDGGLLLVDAAGTAVPYAVLRTSTSGAMEEGPLSFRPVDRGVWETGAADNPVDELAFSLPDLGSEGPVLATVRWPGGSVGPELLYYVDSDTDRHDVAVPHVPGPFRIELRPVGTADIPSLDEVQARREPPDHVPPVEQAYTLGGPVITEDGYARYVVRLGGPRHVVSVHCSVPATADIFDRQVRLATSDEAGGNSSDTRQIRRLHVGAATADRVDIDALDLHGDTLTLEIATDRGRVLPIDGVTVRSEGATLLVRDAGADPHTLYAGATEPDQPYDLAYAASEILRLGPPAVHPGPAVPNPSYQPLPTRTGVDAPGPDLRLSRFRFERPIVGDAGWVRIALDRAVLAHARADLADVRVVDADGAQVPFLLRDTGDEDPWPTAPFVRTEDGDATLLRVPLDSNAPVATVSIDTPNDVFERDVTVLRDAGRTTVPLRQVSWSGIQRGATLNIGVGEPVGDALLIRFHNGDNPPLSIDAVRVTSPRWELRTRLPAAGARLVYGAPGEEAPSYDLSLLRAEVERLPVADATVGEERSLVPPALGWADRAMTVAGIGLLVLGLLGMVGRALSGLPPAETQAPG